MGAYIAMLGYPSRSSLKADLVVAAATMDSRQAPIRPAEPSTSERT